LVSQNKNDEQSIFNDQKFKENARMKLFEPLVHTIEAGLSTLDEEETAVEKLGMIQY